MYTLLLGDLCVKVLQHCDWRARAHVSMLNRQSNCLFGLEESHWLWMCQRLAEESLLFCPSVRIANSPSWRDLFLELYPLRALFEDKEAQPEEVVVVFSPCS